MNIFSMYQFLLNITGESRSVLDLKHGKAVDRRAMLGWEAHESQLNLDLAMNLYIHCQEFGLATKVFEKLEKMDVGLMRFHIFWHVRVFNFSIVAIHNAKKKLVNRRPWIKRARKYVSMIRDWVKEGKAINMGHKILLLEAELLTLRVKKPYPTDATLKKVYDDVITRSARSGFLHEAALASAFAANAVSNNNEKQRYALRAQQLYKSWDARGIISHLQKSRILYKEGAVIDSSNCLSNASSSRGCLGKQQFGDKGGILEVHRSITAAEDKVRRDNLL